MLELAADLAYLVAATTGDFIVTLLAFVVLFTVALAVRDGIARVST